MPLILFLLFLYVCIPAPSGAFSPPPLAQPSSLASPDKFLPTEFNDQKLLTDLAERSFFKEKKFIRMSLETVCRKAADSNLSIKIAEIDKQIIQKDFFIKESVFDPVFHLSAFYTMINTYERTENITRERRKEVNWEEFEDYFRTLSQQEITEEGGSGGDAICPDCEPCVYVDGVLVNGYQCREKYEVSSQKEYASVAMKNGSIPSTLVGTFGVSKKFSWGQGLGVTLQTTNREKPYPPLGEYAALYTYDSSSPRFPYGENPWSSTLSFSFSTPVPFCKNYGAYGSRDNIDPKLAQIKIESMLWHKKNVENTILSNVHKAFWELVGNLQRLRVIQQAKGNLSLMAEKTTRLYLEKMRTSYDKAQVDGDLGIMESREELVLNDLLINSNRLQELLGMRENILLLPTAYENLLAQTVTEEEIQTDYADTGGRADLLEIYTDLTSSKAMFKYMENQALPEVNFSLSVNYSQENTYFGYKSFADSWGNIFTPDNENYFIGIMYKMPLGNNAAKANLQRARVAKNRNESRVILKENSVITEINIALAKVQLNEGQVFLATEKLKLMEAAYRKAVDLREESLEITDFEILYKHRDLIDARLGLVTTLVDRRKALVDLLTAKGTVADLYQ